MPPLPGFRGSLAERFEANTIPEPNSGCLLWFGAARKRGYGRIRSGNGREVIEATHVALALDGRPVPAGKQALHKCDNPYCVNANHLFIGDAKANVADMIAKARQNFSGLALGRGK